MRLPVPWVFVLAFLVGVGLQFLVPIHIGSSAVVLLMKIAGGVLLVVGAWVAAWGLFIFHRAGTTTVPGAPSLRLVTEGPYRFSRNPMYVGLVLAYLGEAGLLTQIWPLFLLPFTVAYVNWVVIPVEEASLKVFQDRYEQCCARVRRWV
jgi:protein-S-isoprenylcysteine O-methyltransferase Ste14